MPFELHKKQKRKRKFAPITFEVESPIKNILNQLAKDTNRSLSELIKEMVFSCLEDIGKMPVTDSCSRIVICEESDIDMLSKRIKEEQDELET